MLILQRRTRNTRGFTLTEAAIVLGIMGLILGAIWVAAASVFNNLRQSRANEQLLSIVQSIRSLHASSNGVGTAATLTADLRQAGAFPNDMVQVVGGATVVNNPWNNMTAGGSVLVTGIGVGGPQFRIDFTNLPQAACIGLLTANTGQGRDTGLTSAGNATSSTSTFPITATAAVPFCTAAAATASFTFNLRG